MPVTTLPQTTLGGAIWDQITAWPGLAALLVPARLFQNAPPSDAWKTGESRMFGVLRVDTPRTRDEIPGQFTAHLAIEVTTFGTPRGQLATIRAAGDLIQDALRNIVLSPAGGGFIRINSNGRQLVPPGTGDADANVVSERHLAEGWIYHLPPA